MAKSELEYASMTTLNAIRKQGPCEDGWSTLLSFLGKTKADDEPLSVKTILESNGLIEALWVLDFAVQDNRLARHFQAWCAARAMRIFKDERPSDIRVISQIIMLSMDDATDEERALSRAWAEDAERDEGRANGLGIGYVAMAAFEKTAWQGALWAQYAASDRSIHENDYSERIREIYAQRAQLEKMLAQVKA